MKKYMMQVFDVDFTPLGYIRIGIDSHGFVRAVPEPSAEKEKTNEPTELRDSERVAGSGEETS